MIIKQGQYGPFLACSGYPECKNTKSINSNHAGQDTGVKCPENGCSGNIVERRSRRGKIFYGCSRYPECTFATWDKPVAKECPECGAKFLVEKTTKKEGAFYACIEKGCGYKENKWSYEIWRLRMLFHWNRQICNRRRRNVRSCSKNIMGKKNACRRKKSHPPAGKVSFNTGKREKHSNWYRNRRQIIWKAEKNISGRYRFSKY